MPELLRGVCSAAEGAAATEPAAKKAKPNTVSKRKLRVQPKITASSESAVRQAAPATKPAAPAQPKPKDDPPAS